MKRLFIIGAGPFGRELFGWFKQDFYYTSRFSFAGFLDDRKSLLDDHGDEYKIVGDPFNFPFSKDDFCIIGLADPIYKSELIKQINGNSSIISFISSSHEITSTCFDVSENIESENNKKNVLIFIFYSWRYSSKIYFYFKNH